MRLINIFNLLIEEFINILKKYCYIDYKEEDNEFIENLKSIDLDLFTVVRNSNDKLVNL